MEELTKGGNNVPKTTNINSTLEEKIEKLKDEIDEIGYYIG